LDKNFFRNFLTPSTYNAISINVGRNNDSNNIFNYEVPNKNFRFQFALFCCLIWTSTFIALCKGKKSLSIVTLVITIFSYVGIFLLNLRFLIFLNFKPITELFSNTNFREFFANSNCWYNAAQETFFTWGLLGVSILSIYKRKSTDDNNNNESNGISFKREIILIISLTFFGLFLSAILGSICLMNIKTNGLTTISIAGNFTSKYHFTSIDEEWINRYNSIIGEVSIRGDFVYKKMLRLVTEFMPWTLAILISEPVWGILFFVSLIFLGLSQNAVMWRPISTLIGNSTSTVLLSCGSALLLMFPLTTDEGQNIVQYLDFIFGGAWWVNLMWAFYLISIFIVRGSPYTSDTLVQNLKFNSFISAFIAFSWTFTIPTGLIILTVLNYKRSFSKILFKSNYSDITMSYWPQWTLRLGGFFQISMLCIVPLIAIYELYYHLTKGPRDILEVTTKFFFFFLYKIFICII
jgi:solute carrier family 6 (neurotransmitter transporter), invertebrate